MAPLEPWEKVLVEEGFFETTHGSDFTCIDCHEGENRSDKLVAHDGIIKKPSEPGTTLCTECHSEMNGFENSLHATQQGYWTTLEARGADPQGAEEHLMFGNHCSSCHTSCGDCHVSQPSSVGGGFINGHTFNETPSLTRNCTACHGSRVGNEYMGKNEETIADVHFRQARMNCVDCHSGESMHGTSVEEAPNHRYDGEMSPDCKSCHEEILSFGNNDYHNMHIDQLSCQVCHSTTYTSCDNCHVSISEETGHPMFSTDWTYPSFMIGKNYIQNENRPEDYVLLRHVPIDPNSFSFYDDNMLPNFDNSPTWVYTTPHNIQLNTPQTNTCNSCHGNEAIFLTADKVAESEKTANEAVIIEGIPPIR